MFHVVMKQVSRLTVGQVFDGVLLSAWTVTDSEYLLSVQDITQLQLFRILGRVLQSRDTLVPVLEAPRLKRSLQVFQDRHWARQPEPWEGPGLRAR